MSRSGSVNEMALAVSSLMEIKTVGLPGADRAWNLEGITRFGFGDHRKVPGMAVG